MTIGELLVLSINGTRRDDIRDAMSEVEIEEHVECADVFRIRLPIVVRGNRTWTHLDNDDLAIWNRIAIRAGYPDDHDTLIDGFITHVHVVLSGSGADESYLELTGGDTSVVMDLEDKQVAWVNKKDSDIARAIFESYGLAWEIEDTEFLRADSLATTMQSETDIRFLQRLAVHNGFECFVQDGRGYFRSADLAQPPQRKLTVPVGNAIALRFEVDGTPPSELEIRRIDPFARRQDRVQREELTDLAERQLARRTLADLRGDTRTGRRLLQQRPTMSNQEMRARLRAGYAAPSSFVTVSGEIDGRSYGAVLRARRQVTIDGAGTTHSGNYYVTRVRHMFYPDSYVQSFEARRNAVGLLGTESFDTPDLVPITPSSPLSSDNRLLPAQHTGSFTPGDS
jgi:phage protein D